MKRMKHKASAHSRHTAWWRVALVLLAAWWAHPAQAQVLLVQSSGLFGNTAGITATSNAFSTNPVVGHTIVVLVWTWTENTSPTIVVTDSAGNTFTSATQAIIDQSAWYESAAVFYAQVATTGANYTVTVNMPNNDGESQSRVVALEYAGVGVVDQVAATTGSSPAASVSTAAATAQANELVVSAVGVDHAQRGLYHPSDRAAKRR
jgi:hypothetical protein